MDSTPSWPPTRVLGVAAWFGLTAGLVEGIGLLIIQKLRWFNWRLSWQFAVSPEIIWVSAFFDLLLFVLVALAVILLRKLIPALARPRAIVFVPAFLTFFDWLALGSRMELYGVFLLALGLASVVSRWFARHQEFALRVWRRTLPAVAALALLAFVGVQGGQRWAERRAIRALPKAAPNAPNILVIVVDTLRADHLSTYGYTRPTSPNLDRLATRGVLFERAFATSSWTLPSHASLLTGWFPSQHGADGTYRRKQLGNRYPTLAEALRDRGYRTAAFSGNCYMFGRREGFGRGFIYFDDYFHSLADMAVRTVYGQHFERYVLRPRRITDVPGRRWAKEMNAAAWKWLEKDSDKPFFVFLNYMDVHDPYLPPQPFRSRFSKQKNPGGIVNGLLGRYYPEMTPEELQGEIDAYDGAIRYVDEHIGRLLDELEHRGLGENTIVVVTSDHGESLGEHGLLGHFNALYRELIHVPLIIRWTKHLPEGLRVTTPVTNASLPATLLELLDPSGKKVFPGPSLVSLWEAPSANPDWPLPLAELAQFNLPEMKKTPAYHGAMKSLVSRQWHFITHEALGDELYDWNSDPEQRHNLASTPEGQRVASDFSLHLRRILARAERVVADP